ncbi:MAG: S8 family serine peptidase [Lautropia sp.]|nr:S8 family serine peptidase [Lautropia sp.]
MPVRQSRRSPRVSSSLPLLMGISLLAACGSGNDGSNSTASSVRPPANGAQHTPVAGMEGADTQPLDEIGTDEAGAAATLMPVGGVRNSAPVLPPGRPGNTVTPTGTTGNNGAPVNGVVPVNGAAPVGTLTPANGTTATPPADATGPQAGAAGTPVANAPALATRYRVGEQVNDPTCLRKFHYREPDLRSSGADPDFPLQWNLQNTGSREGTVAGEDINVINAWAAGKGEGIRIAVVDTSADVFHPDLLPNIVPGESYNYGPWNRGSAYPLPCAGENHGTSVGGVLGARDNNGLGITGVAPRASLVFYNPLREAIERERAAGPLNEASDEADSLVRGLDKNHIYNLSWARGPLRFGHFAAADDMRTGIAQGIAQGRGGLGAIYVVSANNYGNCQYSSNGVCRPYLSNWNGVASTAGSVTVCATTAYGKRAPYSNQGANLLVCAPSASPANDETPYHGILSTTAQGTTAASGYTRSFGGTSAAAPMVSGVTALMLQANPLLTWRDVRLILAQTARRVDPQSASWTRFGNLSYSHDYGFGVVDAEAAVNASRTWQSVGGSSTLKQCHVVAEANQAAIPGRVEAAGDLAQMMDANRSTIGYLQSSVSIPANCDIGKIEHVEVKLNGQNIRAVGGNALDAMIGQENLHILLTSPSRQSSILSTPHECMAESTTSTGDTQKQKAACAGLNGYTFGVTRHMDEPAVTASSRDWTLSLMYWQHPDHGNDPSSNLALNRWELTLYGR